MINNSMSKSNFNKYPFIDLQSGFKVYSGWKEIIAEIRRAVSSVNKDKIIVTLEVYHGADENEFLEEIGKNISSDSLIAVKDFFKSSSEIEDMLKPYLTDDPVFGRLNDIKIDDYFDAKKLNKARTGIEKKEAGIIFVCGTGASLLAEPDLLIYADMARWEIQQRFRRNEISNLGLENSNETASLKYKHAFFVDWRVCDKLKQTLFEKWNLYLDTNNPLLPNLITGEAVREAMKLAVSTPFELVPYFDPGPWGGQWMKEVCGLDKTAENFAWCFNCVPEENSLLVKIDDTLIEMPAINLVFYRSVELLGKKVYEQFGAEFPIRFDFLDTMRGGNLSLQVHPTKEYIKEQFNWPYTQDESYYLMDAEEGANVYLGLKENINPQQFNDDLVKADKGEIVFPDEKYVQKWPVKKHDHVLIPGGTVHCSGKGAMVLEISSTPYIFTFKLWDWGRMGLNGLPRPIHITHGMNVIQFDRTTEWTGKNLINRIEKIAAGEGWIEEKTGLHELELIETRRYWFEKPFKIITGGGVNVLNLVEGDEIIVESPDNKFAPLTVHYAETFIIPAAVEKYIVKPSVKSVNKTFALIRAYIR